MYQNLYKDKNIFQQKKDGIRLYDQIQEVYLTFLSMETKTCALNWIFREDGKTPRKLEEYYQNHL